MTLGYGGCETYLREFLPRLRGSPHTFTLLLPTGRGVELRRVLPPEIRAIDAPARTQNAFARFVWQRRSLPKLMRELNAEVLFVPTGLSGACGAQRGFRVVTMLQNMLPFDARERARYAVTSYPWMRLRLWLLSRFLPRNVRRSDRVIFISRHAAERISPLLNGTDSRVIAHGIPQAPPNEDAHALLARHGVQKPFALYVSLTDPYKHQCVVIDGFQRYRQQTAGTNLQLVLAGPVIGAYGEQVRSAAQRGGATIVCTGGLKRADVYALMRAADVLLFASTCENCPFILLEYLRAGRPIICSRTPPMPEFGGDAAVYVDAENPAEWATALASVLSDPQTSQAMAQRALTRQSLYTWEETVARTIDALTQW